jgi:hypothetical protein
MRLRANYRVPVLLLGCLVTALTFPRACSETRVGIGSLVPATAPLTAAETADPRTELSEKLARALHEIARLEDELEARPLGANFARPGDDAIAAPGSARGVRYVRPSADRARVAVSARVIHRDVSATRRSFLIDAGRADGVEPGLAVVWGGSLVGVVVTAVDHSARVVRIDDPSTASVVSAAILPASGAATTRRARGVSRGTGDGETSVSFLGPADAKPGDVAVTGAGDARIPEALGDVRIPEGLVLGEVVVFGDQDRDGSYEAQIKPFRDLDSIESVHVLSEDREDGPTLRRTRK